MEELCFSQLTPKVQHQRIELEDRHLEADAAQPTPPMQHLPHLVIENLLSFLGAKDVFEMRFLSQEWNRSASESLRAKCKIPISFSTSSEMGKFLEDFEKRPQNWPNPFSAFHLYADKMDVLPLLRIIGQDVKIGIFEFAASHTCSQTYLTFLDLTPNIQQLCFYGNTTMAPAPGLSLPGLRTLGLCKGPSNQRSMTPFESFEFGRSSDATLDFEQVNNWLQFAPGLQELRLNFTVLVNCGFEFARFIQARGLTHLTLNGLRLRPEVFGPGQPPIKIDPVSRAFKKGLMLELKTHERGFYGSEDAATVSNFVAGLSDSITRCSVDFENENVIRLPDLRHCVDLRVGLRWNGCSPPPITALGFPCLRTVTLETLGVVPAAHPFTCDSFPTVDTLQLVLRYETGFALQDWHVTFPRVTCLRVATEFSATTLRYLWTHFAHVSRLHLYCTGTKYDGKPGLVQTALSNDHLDSNGHFTKFENLLQLELEEEAMVKDIAPLLKRVVALTAAKRIQPLQHLTIFCKKRHANPRETRLLQTLRELNWNQNVDLICQSKPSYHKW